ncbi:MAG TPA: DUF4431 domain-containing protein, partial [Gemmatimonadaceae bacterium]|nr:DUF4431 domain-containing protein [Gemmatimonadaceae bacterium]
AALVPVVPAAAQQAAELPACVRLEPDTTTLRGTLVRLTFPGPPNYESVADGDSAESIFALVVPQGVCTIVENRTFHVQLMQLLLSAEDFERYRPLHSREVEVRGTVSRAETGHHHTPLLLRPQGIGGREAKAPAADRPAAALAAVVAVRERRPGDTAVIVPGDAVAIDPAAWRRHGFAVAARDTTVRASFFVRDVAINGDTAVVRVEAGFRGTIRGHAEWWDVRLLRDGRAWIVSALTLALIT